MKKFVLNILGITVLCSFLSFPLTVFATHLTFSNLQNPDDLSNQLKAQNWQEVDSITIIGNLYKEDFNAFWNCSCLGNLRYVDISSAKVENNKIPDWAFYEIGYQGSFGRTKLEEIKLPDDIDEFGKYCFAYTKLKDFKFPQKASKFGNGCFQGCRDLAIDLVLPEYMTEVPECMFQYCSSLKSVKFPPHLKFIGRWGFANCMSLTELNLNDELEHIQVSAFESCRLLKKVKIPDSVEIINFSAFSGLDICDTVILGKGLKLVETIAFANLEALKYLEINCNITKDFCWTLGDRGYCFEYYPNLKSATYGEGVQFINHDILDQRGYADVWGAIETLHFPASLTSIGEGVLHGYKYLKKIECKAIVPPLAMNPMINDGNEFDEANCAFGRLLPKDVIVYVPAESIEAYKNDWAWSYFHDFRPIESGASIIESAIPEFMINVYNGKVIINLNNSDTIETGYIYNCSGQLVRLFEISNEVTVDNLNSGIYIIKVGSIAKKVKI